MVIDKSVTINAEFRVIADVGPQAVEIRKYEADKGLQVAEVNAELGKIRAKADRDIAVLPSRHTTMVSILFIAAIVGAPAMLLKYQVPKEIVAAVLAALGGMFAWDRWLKNKK